MRVRLPRALHEFALVPVLVVLGLLLLGAVSIVGDQAHGAFFAGVRSVLGHFIGAESATGTLTAVATGLVTVTSITFSVLLLAVQQTASNLSPVVFDQFVRRRANQVYLGLFVGLALYSYVVMAAVQPKTPPIIGAFFATVLTVVALGCLLFLVYSTIDQMRPRNVMRQLHDRAVRAHEREGDLVRRTRREPASELPVLATYRSETFGYVESVNLDRIVGLLSATGAATAGEPEVELHVTVGAEVVIGDLVASVRHHDERSAEHLRDEVARAVVLSPAPDLDFDASTGVTDIANIAWTSGSTSKQNPAIAAQALHALRDLATRWVAETRTGDEPCAVVYADNDLDTVLEALYSAIVVAHEAHQQQQAVRVLDAYVAVLGHARGEVADRLQRDLSAMRPLLDELPSSPALDDVRRRVDAALGERSQATGLRSVHRS
jgi:uncharacterized membrane protein